MNNWGIGKVAWSAAPLAVSAHSLAASARRAATGLTGWMLPAGDGWSPAGELNQFNAIWNDVGATLAGLRAQFDGVQSADYWSGSTFDSLPIFAWAFGTSLGGQSANDKTTALYVVAVRAGDVAAAVPEPQTWLAMLAGLGVVALAWRVRSR